MPLWVLHRLHPQCHLNCASQFLSGAVRCYYSTTNAKTSSQPPITALGTTDSASLSAGCINEQTRLIAHCFSTQGEHQAPRCLLTVAPPSSTLLLASIVRLVMDRKVSPSLMEKMISQLQVRMLGGKGDPCSIPDAFALLPPGRKHLQRCPTHRQRHTRNAVDGLSSGRTYDPERP